MHPYPKISIVTPSYNQAAFLERTIHSVIGQGYPELEYIIIDGASNDGSADIIRRHESHIAYWASEPDNGQTDALIKGFARSTGDIMCWLCSDDELEPGTLLQVAAFFEANPAMEVVYGNALWIDVHGRVVRPKKEHAFDRFIWLYDHNFIPQPSTFWRRRLYERVGGLDPSFDLAMDGDLWIRFAEVTRLHHVPKTWSRMRLHSEQKVQKMRNRAHQEDARIRARYVAYQSPTSRRVKHGLAKSTRVVKKLLQGCYW